MKGMNQSFLVDELTKFFFVSKRNINLRQVEVVFDVNFPVFVTIVVLLMGSRNHPPQPVVISSSIFPHLPGPGRIVNCWIER